MSKFKKDIQRMYDTSHGSRPKRVISTMLSAGIRSMAIFRFGQWVDDRSFVVKLFLMPVYFILNQRVKWKFGIQIPKSAQIGEGFYIGHYGGITIAADAVIGKNVNITQLVTIGESGKGDNYGAPTIGDNVFIGAGAKVIGKIKVGNRVKIGANAVVYKDIPDDAVVVSYPGYKIISYEGNQREKS